MKDYFIRLFQYDAFANRLLVNAMKEQHAPEKSRSLMAHLLATQQVWLKRCKGEVMTGAQWPDWTVDTFEATIAENNRQWIAFLSEQKEDIGQQQISYINGKGLACTDYFCDILGHAINHGTHHRAQIGQDLKQNGAESLPMTDYILYVWETKAKGFL